MDGNQLAIVRYRPDHNAVMNEWVYNRRISTAPKWSGRGTWMPRKIASCSQYFHGRRAWLVEADETPPKVSPYP